MALAIMEAFGGRRVLVTTRVPKAELVRSFPWLDSPSAEPSFLIDGSDHPGSLSDSSRVAERLSSLVKPGDSGEPSLRGFLWLPPAVQEAWSLLETRERSIVVIDSWDALIEDYLGKPHGAARDLPGREEIERILLGRMQQTPAHLVLVLERREETQLDYLVNGTVVTEREVRAERLERWLHLPKLRGVRIANGAYPFTLEGARFQCIEPIRSYSKLASGKCTPEPDPIPGYLWPGSSDFADIFGRLPLGGISLIETGEGVQRNITDLIADPLVSHTLMKGGRVALTPPVWRTPTEIWEAMRHSVPRHRFLELLRIVDVHGESAKGPSPGKDDLASILMSIPHPISGRISPELSSSPIVSFVRESATDQNPGLLLINATGLEALMARSSPSPEPSWRETFPTVLQRIVYRCPLHAMVLGRRDAPVLAAVREVASVQLRMEARQGRTILHGIHPWSPSLLLTDAGVDAPYGLLRVV